MEQGRSISRRIRKVVDEPGLKAAIAADVNIVTSGGGRSEATQSVHVRQRRSARATAGGSPAGGHEPDPPTPDHEEQS